MERSETRRGLGKMMDFTALYPSHGHNFAEC